MDNLFPLFFVLYIISTIVSALVKKLKGKQPEESTLPRHDLPIPRPVPKVEDRRIEPVSSVPPVAPIPQVPPVPDPVGVVESAPVESRYLQPQLTGPAQQTKPRRPRLLQSDVRRGILMAEIIGEPRALRPYRPPIVRR